MNMLKYEKFEDMHNESTKKINEFDFNMWLSIKLRKCKSCR